MVQVRALPGHPPDTLARTHTPSRLLVTRAHPALYSSLACLLSEVQSMDYEAPPSMLCQLLMRSKSTICLAEHFID